MIEPPQGGYPLAMRFLGTMLAGLTLGGSLLCSVASGQAQALEVSPEHSARVVTTPWVLHGYVETDWQWNFDKPGNGITNYRGFDNRHDTLTLSNAVLDVAWDSQDVLGRVALQVGHTPSTYYLAEPTSAGTSGADRSDAELWKYVQQAYVGYRFHPFERELTVQAGIFLSPIGPESMVVHENWTWSRSNLFFALPFYHTGARAALTVSADWTLTLAVYNGWNSVVDDNRQKSVSLQAVYAPSRELSWNLLYFGGVERPTHAPEGRPFRQLLDTYLSWQLSERVALMVHAHGGLEPGRFGTTTWAGGALSGRLSLLHQLALAARVDGITEHAAHDAEGTAARILFPARWVSSSTLTLDYRPAETISFRLEGRSDHAASNMYFRGRVPSDGSANARHGETLTLGLTAWF